MSSMLESPTLLRTGVAMSENTHDAIRSIAASSGRTRDNLIHEFMRARMGLFKQIAWGLCRRYGHAPDQHVDDFASIVSMTALKMLTEELANDELLERIENWEGMLRVQARAAVRDFIDKDGAPMTEMTSALRRKRVLDATRDEIRREMGTEPTPQEIVDTHNAKMWEKRANPVKQGVIASVNDLRVSRVQDDIADHDYSVPIDTDFVLHPVEGPRFIQLIVERTSAYNERLGKAAELWLSGLYSDKHEPRIASVDQIAEALDVSRSTARAYVRKIKEYAVQVAQDEFAISEDDL
ncbi:HTH domain-containing protein [Arthrobacter sp. UYCo732]|uniref:HTH domain-containing protein n=1 Tax=Arthrobacter sp. UYCo732 TaxID=3156336 RepID=UPI003396420C